MRRNINTAHIEGYVYQHSLAIKQVQNQASANFGKDFISGELEVAVDEKGLNVIAVHFTYVTETTSKGNKNATYAALKSIIDRNETWTSVGKDAAMKVKIDTALALNDFYANDDTLVSAKRNEGGFVTIVNGSLCAEKDRNTFSTDIVITNVKHVDADEEKGIVDHTEIRGAVFDFRNAILPVDFVVENPQGMQYFESLDIDSKNPLYTKVWGKINCKTTTRSVTEETAFGEAAVTNYERKVRNWVVTGTSTNSYEFGDEKVMTSEELTKAIQDRQVYLADVKKRADDYKASKNAGSATPAASTATAAPAKKGSFNF